MVCFCFPRIVIVLLQWSALRLVYKYCVFTLSCWTLLFAVHFLVLSVYPAALNCCHFLQPRSALPHFIAAQGAHSKLLPQPKPNPIPMEDPKRGPVLPPDPHWVGSASVGGERGVGAVPRPVLRCPLS